MKRNKLICCILLCLIICMASAGCGATKSNVVGTWQGSYVFQDDEFDCTVTINPDGTFHEVLLKNGSPYKDFISLWYIDEGKLCLCDDNLPAVPEYTLSGDMLINGEYVRLKRIG